MRCSWPKSRNIYKFSVQVIRVTLTKIRTTKNVVKTHKYIQCLLNLKHQRANSEIVQWNFRLLISSVSVCVCASINYLHLYSYIWLFSLLFMTPTRTGDRHQEDSCAVFEIPFVQFRSKWKHFVKNICSRVRKVFLTLFLTRIIGHGKCLENSCSFLAYDRWPRPRGQ